MLNRKYDEANMYLHICMSASSVQETGLIPRRASTSMFPNFLHSLVSIHRFKCGGGTDGRGPKPRPMGRKGVF